jgi:hypothetical protein
MSGGIFTATPEQMAKWAEDYMAARVPDFVIGEDYLRRWWVIPRNDQLNVYLHDIRKSDDDRAMHDHPWENTSYLLVGGYMEHTPEGTFERRAGDIVHRTAETAHRLELIPGVRAISLFVTGPKVRDWGFHCPKGWVHWKLFTDFDPARGIVDSSHTGRGCGEMA